MRLIRVRTRVPVAWQTAFATATVPTTPND